ncbi:hypothetical protein QFZ76_000342 [Streptomyces sp. V4I2]|nr:hypothetical protein [Streptomyces sp. V4I2]
MSLGQRVQGRVVEFAGRGYQMAQEARGGASAQPGQDGVGVGSVAEYIGEPYSSSTSSPNSAPPSVRHASNVAIGRALEHEAPRAPRSRMLRPCGHRSDFANKRQMSGRVR